MCYARLYNVDWALAWCVVFLLFWWAHKIKFDLQTRVFSEFERSKWAAANVKVLFVFKSISVWLDCDLAVGALWEGQRGGSNIALPRCRCWMKQLARLLPHRECILNCLLFAYEVFWCLWKSKALASVLKKSWIHWGMPSDIATCFWAWNVWYLKVVEMVNVHVIIITVYVLIFFKRTLSDVVLIYKHILS